MKEMVDGRLLDHANHEFFCHFKKSGNQGIQIISRETTTQGIA